MRKLSSLFIAAGIILILLPGAGHIYTSYRQKLLFKAMEKNPQTVEIGTSSNTAGEYEDLDETFKLYIKSNTPKSGGDNGSAAEGTSPPLTPVNAAAAKADAPKKEAPKPIGILEIKKIDLKIPVLEGVGSLPLSLGAGHIPKTAGIGEVGNCALAGHRSYTFGKFFNRLDELSTGDEIVLTSGGKSYCYIIYDKKIIEPTDTSVLSFNEKDRRLTLITCHPPTASTYRLVIQAKIGEAAAGQPATTS